MIDEINSYRDSPSDLIFDDFDKSLFKAHSLGNDILGTEEQVKSISRSAVINFVKKHYITSNIVISSVGNYSIGRLKNQLEKYFSIVPSKTSIASRIKPKFKKPKDIEVKKGLYQTHTILGGKGLGADNSNRSSLLLANNIIGGPAMNSRLNLNIRE